MFAKEDRPPLFASASIYIIGALFVAFTSWASYAEVDEIARGEGKVIPASKTQIIQASEAGVVQEIAVQIGQTVKKNDLIIRLEGALQAMDDLGVHRAPAGLRRIAQQREQPVGNP